MNSAEKKPIKEIKLMYVSISNVITFYFQLSTSYHSWFILNHSLVATLDIALEKCEKTFGRRQYGPLGRFFDIYFW